MQPGGGRRASIAACKAAERNPGIDRPPARSPPLGATRHQGSRPDKQSRSAIRMYVMSPTQSWLGPLATKCRAKLGKIGPS